MRLVRLILVTNYMIDDYGDNRQVILDGITDWEELSEQEYKFIRDNLWRLSSIIDPTNSTKVLLLEKDSQPIRARIESIKDWIAKEKAEREKATAEAEAKRKERAQRRLLKKHKSERELLEALKQKYPDVT